MSAVHGTVLITQGDAHHGRSKSIGGCSRQRVLHLAAWPRIRAYPLALNKLDCAVPGYTAVANPPGLAPPGRLQ